MYQTSHTNQISTPKGQVNYQDWELEVLKAVAGKGVTADQLTHVIKRSIPSITKKAGALGYSLKGLKSEKEKRLNKKPKASGKVLDVIRSLGTATTSLIIRKTEYTEAVVRSCLKWLVDNDVIKYKKNESTGGFTSYVYYI